MFYMKCSYFRLVLRKNPILDKMSHDFKHACKNIRNISFYFHGKTVKWIVVKS